MEGKNGSAKTHKVDFPWDFFLAGSGAWRWVPTYSHLSEKSSTMKKKNIAIFPNRKITVPYLFIMYPLKSLTVPTVS